MAYFKGVFDGVGERTSCDTEHAEILQLFQQSISLWKLFWKGLRPLLLAIAAWVGFAATMMFSVKSTSLKTHVGALHLLYVHERMPISAEEQAEVFCIKIRRPAGNLIRCNVYRSLSDSWLAVEEEPLFMWSRLCC